MRVGILRSGGVGRVLSDGLAGAGHDVMLGTRDVGALLARPADGGESFSEWHEANPAIAIGSFADTAAHGEVVINATAGGASLEALRMADADNLAGKILIDVANPLDFSAGFPPTLTVANVDSLGEQIQRALPDTRVVKALNTVTAVLMVDPQRLAGGEHHLFVCGDDVDAKATVTRWLQQWFGWRHVVDLGGIEAARATEMYLALWTRTMRALGTPMFNVRVVPDAEG